MLNIARDKKQIFVIEDNEGDASLIQEALITSSLDCAITRFRNGTEALRVLLNPEASIPDVILLDLNMPGSDGIEVLLKIRHTPRLTYTPVAILTGSRAPSDKLRASVIGATRYVHKPMRYDKYIQVVRTAVEEMLQGESPGSSSSAHV